MTDDGQAQNSLHENSSNCVGLMGWGESSPTHSTVVYNLHVHIHADIPNEKQGS